MRQRIGLRHWRLCKFEVLEWRQLLSASLGTEETSSIILSKKVKHFATPGPTGLSPAQVAAAYGFNKIQFMSTTGGQSTMIPGDGTGTTIAIVDAYNDPTISGDLQTFDRQFNLPDPPSFKIVNQRGGAALPPNDPGLGWAGEISLDVEWAHAMAPKANILLVEADSQNQSSTGALVDLLAAVDYARKQPGVVAISDSWGSPEYKTETHDDYRFTTPSGHTGETFIFSAGDSGAPANYPSASPLVLSVGGTNLKLNKDNTWNSESAWSLATGNGAGGGGPSLYESLPSYQNGLGATRGTPDVSYNGDPATGVSVLSSFADGGWVVFGGTSAGAPQWASLIAIADQGRALVHKTPLANAQVAVYSLRGDFHDITSGNNGLAAGPGYDFASGLGTPIASSLVPDLVKYAGSTSLPPPFPAPANPSTGAAVPGPWWWSPSFPTVNFLASDGNVANSLPVGGEVVATVFAPGDSASSNELAAADYQGTVIAPSAASVRISNDAIPQGTLGSHDDVLSAYGHHSVAKLAGHLLSGNSLDDFFGQFDGSDLLIA